MAKAQKSGGLYYGWVIAICCFLIYLFATGPCTYGTSIVATRMVTDMGWDSTVVGGSSSLYYAGIAVMCLVSSQLARKIGNRKMLIITCIFGIVIFVFQGYINTSPIVFRFMYFLIGIYSAACSLTCPMDMLAQWFDRNRGIPFSILAVSGSVGGVITPPIVSALCDRSSAYAWTLFIVLAAANLLISIFLLKDRPEEIGEICDSRAWVEAHPLPAKAGGAVPEEATVTMTECYRSLILYGLLFVLLVRQVCLTSFNSYITLYGIEKGFTSAQGAWMMSVWSTMGLFCRGGTFILDKFNKHILQVISFALFAVGFVVLTLADTYLLYAAGGIMCGLGFGIARAIYSLVLIDIFGKKNFGALNGLTYAIGQIGAIAAPTVVGLLGSTPGGYTFAYQVVAVLAAAATVIAIFTPVRKLQSRKAPAATA